MILTGVDMAVTGASVASIGVDMTVKGGRQDIERSKSWSYLMPLKRVSLDNFHCCLVTLFLLLQASIASGLLNI